MNAEVGTRTNAQWLAQLREGDERAVADLRAFVGSVLERILRTVDAARMQSVTQDALLRILRSLDRFRGDSGFTTWASAVAVRVGLGSAAGRRSPSRALASAEVDDRTSPEPPAARTPDRPSALEALGRAVDDALDERQRTAVLGKLKRVPHAELAERLGTDRAGLYRLYHEARARLRQALCDAGFSDDDLQLELDNTSRTT